MFRIALIVAILLGVVFAVLGRFRTTPAGQAVYSRFPRIDKLVAVLLALSFVAMVITGFYDLALRDHVMTSYVLLLHVGIGGAFAVLLAAFAFLRAEGNAPLDARPATAPPLQKVWFWLFVVCGLVLMMTAAFAMIPWLGTPGQGAVVVIHKWASIVSIVAGIAYFGSLKRSTPARG